MTDQPATSAVRPMVVTSTKSVGIQVLLVFFLGPLGLLYSTIKGALLMLFGIPILFVLLMTLTGVGAARSGGAGMLIALGSEFFLMMATWWIGSFIWGVLAVNRYNKELMAGR